jgi:hypothetical protein
MAAKESVSTLLLLLLLTSDTLLLLMRGPSMAVDIRVASLELVFLTVDSFVDVASEEACKWGLGILNVMAPPRHDKLRDKSLEAYVAAAAAAACWGKQKAAEESQLTIIKACKPIQ